MARPKASRRTPKKQHGRGELSPRHFIPAFPVPLPRRAAFTGPNQNPPPNHKKTNIMSALTTWNPIRELGNFENRLERLFGLTWPSRNGEKEAMTVAQWTPLVDISEDANEYLVKAELPELKKEDVKVSVENGELTISGERKSEKEEKGKKFHRIERSYGSFLRSFTLPEAVSGEKVSAEFKDGMLTVHLPKDEKAKLKTIEVKVQ
jgi:HSP20 family protein